MDLDQPRPAERSRTTLAVLTVPGDANAYGLVHGGVLLRLADECGAVAALRHAGGDQITTAAIDSMTFLAPVHVGERIEVDALVTYVGRTSIESRIEIHAEPLNSLERRRVAVGYGLYVALDSSGRPRPVPPLLIETDEQRRRHDAGALRQKQRLALRAAAAGEAP